MESSSGEVKRSLVCDVCHVATRTYHLSYGANACTSCRAFFRRTVHNRRDESVMICKKGGSCTINESTRRTCKRCRYEKCLQVGMKPDGVLNDEEIKVRFRKMLKKKKGGKVRKNSSTDSIKQEASPTQSSVTDDDPSRVATKRVTIDTPENVRDVLRCKLTVKRSQSEDAGGGRDMSTLLRGITQMPHLKVEEVDDVIATECSAIKMSPASTSGDPSSSPSSSNLFQNDESVFDLFAKRALTTWNQSLSELRSLSSVANDILNLWSETNSSSTKEIIINNHFTWISQVFFTYAHKQPEFQWFPKCDRDKLLERNGKIFLQLILGRVCSSNSIREQLEWLLLNHPIAGQIALPEESNPLSCKDVVSGIGISNEPTNIALSENFKDQSCMNLPKDLIHLVALICLFSQDPQSSLLAMSVDAQRTKRFVQSLCDLPSAYWDDIFNSAKAISDILNDTLKAKGTQNALSFFERVEKPDYELNLGYSDLENAMVEDQLLRHQNSMEVVRFGEDILKEYIQFTMDIPLSKTFIPRALKLFGERFRYILMGREEFFTLSGQEQNQVFQRACLPGLSLLVCKYESFESGFEQFCSSLCRDERQMVECWIGPVADRKRFPKFSMAQKEYLNLLDTNTIRRYLELAATVGKMVHDNEVFEMLLLVVLFHECNGFDLDQSKAFSSLGGQYRTMMRRKMLANLGVEEGEARFQQLFSLMCYIQEMSMIIRNIVQ